MSKEVWSIPNKCNNVYLRSFEQDRKWSLNVPGGLQNSMMRDNHRTASGETAETTTTRWLLRFHYNQDHGQMTPNWDWIRGFLEAIYQRHQLGCLPNSSPKQISNVHTGGLYALSADAEGVRIWILMGTMWEPPAASDDVRNWSWPIVQCTMVWRAHAHLHICVVCMSISWEPYKIDMESDMIDHRWWPYYQVQKLQALLRSQAGFIHADSAQIWLPKQLPKQQQWLLMGWTCRVYKELAEHEC